MVASAASVHVRRWLDGLRARGHEVRLFSTVAEGGATVFPPGVRGLPVLRRRLREFDPDVVNAQYVQVYGIAASLAGARPLVVSAWGSDVYPTTARERFAARIALRRADLVHAMGPSLLPAIEAFGVPRERVVFATHGVDVARFPFGEGPRPIPVLSSRALEPVYDPATIVRAAALLAQRRPDARVRLVGDGSLRPSLEALAANTRAPVEFAGRLPHDRLAEEQRASRVYVSASKWDGVSIALLEAMASGAFPVVSDIPANRAWIEDGATGLLFPVGDAAALADALARALEDDALRERAARANRRRVEEDGDEARNLDRFVTALEGIRRRGPPRSAPRGARPASPP